MKIRLETRLDGKSPSAAWLALPSEKGSGDEEQAVIRFQEKGTVTHEQWDCFLEPEEVRVRRGPDCRKDQKNNIGREKRGSITCRA